MPAVGARATLRPLPGEVDEGIPILGRVPENRGSWSMRVASMSCARSFIGIDSSEIASELIVPGTTGSTGPVTGRRLGWRRSRHARTVRVPRHPARRAGATWPPRRSAEVGTSSQFARSPGPAPLAGYLQASRFTRSSRRPRCSRPSCSDDSSHLCLSPLRFRSSHTPSCKSTRQSCTFTG